MKILLFVLLPFSHSEEQNKVQGHCLHKDSENGPHVVVQEET